MFLAGFDIIAVYNRRLMLSRRHFLRLLWLSPLSAFASTSATPAFAITLIRYADFRQFRYR